MDSLTEAAVRMLPDLSSVTSRLRSVEMYLTLVEERVVNVLNGYSISSGQSKYATELRVKHFRRNAIGAGLILVMIITPLLTSIAFLFLRTHESAQSCPAGTSWSGIQCSHCDSIGWSAAGARRCTLPVRMAESTHNNPTQPFLQCGTQENPTSCQYQFIDTDNVESIATTMCRAQSEGGVYQYDYGRMQDIIVPENPSTTAPDYVVFGCASFSWSGIVHEWATGMMYRAVTFCYNLCGDDERLDITSMQCLSKGVEVSYADYDDQPTPTSKMWQTYDFFEPNGEADGATIVFIHGGFWHGGDKRDWVSVGRWAAARGSPAAVINYRPLEDSGQLAAQGLVPAESIDDMLKDVCHAIEGVHDNTKTKLVFIGHGAGAFLLMTILTQPELLARAGLMTIQGQIVDVAGVVLLGGMFDLEGMLKEETFIPNDLRKMATRVLNVGGENLLAKAAADENRVIIEHLPFLIARPLHPEVIRAQSTQMDNVMLGANYSDVQIREIGTTIDPDPTGLGAFFMLGFGLGRPGRVTDAVEAWIEEVEGQI